MVGEEDPLWQQLRSKHLASACISISALMDEFRSKNKAASYFKNAGESAKPLDPRSMKALATSLPQYRCIQRLGLIT